MCDKPCRNEACAETRSMRFSAHAGRLHARLDGQRPPGAGLQRDALIAAGVDERHLFEDRVSGSGGDRTGLAKALAFIKSGDCLVV